MKINKYTRYSFYLYVGYPRFQKLIIVSSEPNIDNFILKRHQGVIEQYKKYWDFDPIPQISVLSNPNSRQVSYTSIPKEKPNSAQLVIFNITKLFN
jgi:hypothetical protein